MKKMPYPLLVPTPSNILRAFGVATSTLLAAATSIVVGRVVDELTCGASDIGTLLAVALVLALASAAATVLLGEWAPTCLGVRCFLDGAKACAKEIREAIHQADARVSAQLTWEKEKHMRELLDELARIIETELPLC